MDKVKLTYKLPEGWVWTTIGEIGVLSSGGTPSRGNYNYYNGDIPWVKSGELNYNVIKDTEEKITQEALDFSSAKIVPANSLLIALYGSTVGKIATLGIDASTNQAVAAIVTFPNLNQRFLYYYLLHNREKLLQKRKGGAQPNISQKILSEFRFPVPPLNEQNLIVFKIEELLSELDHTEKGIQKAKQQLEVYRQALLKNAFEGKLTENWRIENIPEKFKPFETKNHSLPLGWSISKIDKITEFIGSGSTPRGGRNVYQRNGIPFIRSQNIHVNSFIQNDLVFISNEVHEKMKRTQIKPKDVLLNITGASIGRCAFIPENFEVGNVNQHVCIIRVIHQHVNYKYLTYFLNSPENQLLINRINSGATREAINLTQIKHIELPLCSLSEQMQIVNELESRFSLIEYLEKTLIRSLSDIKIYRHSLLKKAFEGKLIKQESFKESATLLLETIKKEKETYILNMKTLEKKNSSKKKNIRSSLIEIILNNFNQKGFTIEELHSKTSFIYDEFRNQFFELLDKENLIAEFDKNKGQIFYKYQK